MNFQVLLDFLVLYPIVFDGQGFHPSGDRCRYHESGLRNSVKSRGFLLRFFGGDRVGKTQLGTAKLGNTNQKKEPITPRSVSRRFTGFFFSSSSLSLSLSLNTWNHLKLTFAIEKLVHFR